MRRFVRMKGTHGKRLDIRADPDGDGIPTGVELGLVRDRHTHRLQAHPSNPLRSDSDRDHISDTRERRGKTDPSSNKSR